MKPVNLLPQEQRSRAPREGTGKMAYGALGLLAVLLAMVVAYVLSANTVTERESDAEAARIEADRLEAEAARKGSFTDFAQIAETRMASVAGVAASRFDWERVMRELSRVMPDGSWLQAMDASVTGDTEGAGGGSAAAPDAGTGSPSANLVGCTPKQSDVARMMVRLGQMHRVEDVQLAESIQENPQEDPTFDSCGSAYRFDITVTFSAAPPADEAPRGATRVPASLGGGS
jgi:Tfp pilus assembly protein PilN